MNVYLKFFLKAVRWSFSVLGLSFTLAVLLLILTKKFLLVYETNTPWLIVEICFIGFALILQFIPLRD